MAAASPSLSSPSREKKILPFSLAAVILVLDQLSKWLVVERIPRLTVGPEFFGGFIRFIHARNPGIAFSLGRDLPDPLRGVFFTLLPILVLAALGLHYFRSDDFSPIQRWAVAGIIGGGAGNLVDRIFRPEGVVDFIDVEFFGIFGLDRWPTFNIADSSVVVFGSLLALTILTHGRRTHE